MSFLRPRLGLAVAFVLLALTPWKPAMAAGDPRSFMTDVGNHVLSIINDKQSTEDQRKAQFRQLVESVFDIPKISQFVLGRYWRDTNDQQRKSFQSAFEEYMVQVYWSRFNSYNGETFAVTDTRDLGNGTTLVTTQINRPASGQQPVAVVWQLVPAGGSFKIRDASLEGISQAITYRDEFASIIDRDGGVDSLTAQLVQRAKG